jgi:hypothetical protein
MEDADLATEILISYITHQTANSRLKFSLSRSRHSHIHMVRLIQCIGMQKLVDLRLEN